MPSPSLDNCYCRVSKLLYHNNSAGTITAGQRIGNRKIHGIPLPERPRKIKRITLEAFSGIKELVKRVKQPRVDKIRRRRKKAVKKHKITGCDEQGHKKSYEPDEFIGDTRESRLWSWRRVIAWERYINDPLENKKGHRP
jgi:hypothetical protein